MGKSLLEETFRTIKFRRAIMSRMSTKDLQQRLKESSRFFKCPKQRLLSLGIAHLVGQLIDGSSKGQQIQKQNCQAVTSPKNHLKHTILFRDLLIFMSIYLSKYPPFTSPPIFKGRENQSPEVAIFASDSKIQMQHHKVFGPIVKYEKNPCIFIAALAHSALCRR